jgi:hypothetical protein
MMGSDVVRWGDDAQYVSPPIKKADDGSDGPQVKLLWATPDPLGTIAAVCRQFKGIPTYDLADVTDKERRDYWEESFKSHLRAPHEFVQFHFVVEGIPTAIATHMTRQRTATFAQESQRFAVKEDLGENVALPVTFKGDERRTAEWLELMQIIGDQYTAWVNDGVPADDARGALPQNTMTRLHWRTNLNDLLHHAGNRLCTQANFTWRQIFIGVMRAISEYRPPLPDPGPMRVYYPEGLDGPGVYRVSDFKSTRWQFELMGKPTPQTFAPICYHTGKCEFRAIFDRPCVIRDRVDEFAAAGVPSQYWGTGHPRNDGSEIGPIDPVEWLANPDAAR